MSVPPFVQRSFHLAAAAFGLSRRLMTGMRHQRPTEELESIARPVVHPLRAAEAVPTLVRGYARRIDLRGERRLPRSSGLGAEHTCRLEARVLGRLDQEHGNEDATHRLSESILQHDVSIPTQCGR